MSEEMKAYEDLLKAKYALYTARLQVQALQKHSRRLCEQNYQSIRLALDAIYRSCESRDESSKGRDEDFRERLRLHL